MTRIREELAQQLAARLDRHRVVVWVDPSGEYRDVAAELAPQDAAFEPYRGSWYELRRRVEPQLARPDPRLLVYVDADEPVEGPLAELRAAASRYSRQLTTLLRQTLEGELTAARLDEMARTATTLTEAESLLEGGATGAPALLLKILGPHEPTELIIKLATADHPPFDEHPGLFDEAAHFLQTQMGARPDRSDDVVGALARQLALVELMEAVGGLPTSLQEAYAAVTAEQRRRCEAVLHRWKHDQRLEASFNEAMLQVGRDLAVSAEVPWHDTLTEVDTLPAYDALALEEYLTRVSEGRFVEAEDLAAARLASRWVKRDATQEPTQLWRVAHAAAQLRRLIETLPARGRQPITELFRRYVDAEWKTDRAHRRLESALLALTDRSRLESVVREGRQAYDQWLDSHLRGFTSAAEADGLVTGDLLLQGHVHADVVVPYAATGPVGYFMVDALRYELAHDLVDLLRQQFEGGDVQLQPAIGLVPSITPVGMANLCPGAEEGLRLQLAGDDRLLVRIGETPVMTPAHRVSKLQAAHGKVADLRLDDIVRLGDQELREQVEGAKLVLVRSQEIDEQGETGKLHVGLGGFEGTVQLLSRAMAKLAHHGLSRFVVSADHGFIVLTRDVGQHMVIPKPGGRGEVHRRAFIGKGGSADAASLRLPLHKVGVPGDLDVVVPRGLALIAAGGARGFFHGGLSPQELVVPVITVEVEPAAGSSVLIVEATVAPTVTSHILTGQITLPPSLLSEPVTVRPVLQRRADGQNVAVLVTAGGAEEGEGLVRLTPGDEVSLGFRVTSSLDKNDRIALRVFDARTDRMLGESAKPATVARKLEVDDDLA